MVALNFQKQFAAAVESGAKCRTIRAPRKDGRVPVPGHKLQLYTGMRQKGCRKLGDADCIRSRPIQITDKYIVIDGCVLNPSMMSDFAKADGFETVTDMLKFFEGAHGLPFSGWLIEWNLCANPSAAQTQQQE